MRLVRAVLVAPFGAAAGLAQAQTAGWTIVSMKSNCKRVHPC
jgi:hypothetical protein